MPDIHITLRDELGMIGLFPGAIDKLIPQTCYGLIEKDNLQIGFWALFLLLIHIISQGIILIML